MASSSTSSNTPTTGSPTTGVRTWQRTGADDTSTLAERVTETTDETGMAAAIAGADFVTIPRAGTGRTGYDDAYARSFADALAERFGYARAQRVSTSGRSHVFERTALAQGATVDLGVSVGSASGSVTARALAGSQDALTAGLSGDGAALRPPTLAVR